MQKVGISFTIVENCIDSCTCYFMHNKKLPNDYVFGISLCVCAPNSSSQCVNMPCNEWMVISYSRHWPVMTACNYLMFRWCRSMRPCSAMVQHSRKGVSRWLLSGKNWMTWRLVNISIWIRWNFPMKPWFWGHFCYLIPDAEWFFTRNSFIFHHFEFIAYWSLFW